MLGAGVAGALRAIYVLSRASETSLDVAQRHFPREERWRKCGLLLAYARQRSGQMDHDAATDGLVVVAPRVQDLRGGFVVRGLAQHARQRVPLPAEPSLDIQQLAGERSEARILAGGATRVVAQRHPLVEHRLRPLGRAVEVLHRALGRLAQPLCRELMPHRKLL